MHWRIKERMLVDLTAINRTVDPGIVTDARLHTEGTVTSSFLFRTPVHSYVSFLSWNHRLETKNVHCVPAR